MLTVSLNLNVPPLSDNDVAFLNADAWHNYWANINLEATFDPITNTKYTESPYNSNLQYLVLDVNGNQEQIVTKNQFDSLLLAFETLNINYKNLLGVLKDAGLITQST